VQAAVVQSLHLKLGLIVEALTDVPSLKATNGAPCGCERCGLRRPLKHRLVELLPERTDFLRQKPLPLAGTRIVLVVMLKTKKGQVVGPVVARIAVEVGDLSSSDVRISI
jgi:hypothetical protein